MGGERRWMAESCRSSTAALEAAGVFWVSDIPTLLLDSVIPVIPGVRETSLEIAHRLSR